MKTIIDFLSFAIRVLCWGNFSRISWKINMRCLYFPNSDSELKGSTSGQKIGTEETTGAGGASALTLPRTSVSHDEFVLLDLAVLIRPASSSGTISSREF